MTAYLTNDKQVTDEIMTNYVVFLIDSYTITGNPILAGTIKLYVDAVNKYFVAHNLDKAFDHKSELEAARLIWEQAKFEKEPERRALLNTKMMVKMHEFSLKNSCGFHAAAWDFTNLGQHGGFLAGICHGLSFQISLLCAS